MFILEFLNVSTIILQTCGHSIPSGEHSSWGKASDSIFWSKTCFLSSVKQVLRHDYDGLSSLDFFETKL